MRILFVQLPTSHKGAGEIVYPLGLARLAAVTPAEHDCSALDMNLSADPWGTLRERIEQFAPELIALSFRNIDPLAGIQSSYLSSLATAAPLCSRLAPDATIVAGGPAFSLFAEELMELVAEVDLGLVGEGETVFSQILQSPCTPQSIPGLIWRQGPTLRRNPLASVPDIADLPSLAASPFCPADYLKNNAYVAAIGIEGKRGCDLACGYCVYPRLGGGSVSADATEIGWSAGLDTGSGSMMVPFLGGEICGYLGLTGSSMILYPEHVILQHEACRYAYDLLHGFEFDEADMALDVIAKVGPRGHFLAQKHTRVHIRDFRLPLLEQEDPDGNPRHAQEVALDEFKRLNGTHHPKPLPQEVLAELDRILAAAEREAAHRDAISIL